MKSLRPLLFFVSLLLMVGLACSFVTGDTPTEAPPPTEQPIDIDDPTEAPATEAPAIEAPEPTEPPAPEAQPFFTEEFDAFNGSNWDVFTITASDDADPDKVEVTAEDGRLIWKFDSEWVYYYLFYNAYEYEDVQLEARADNRGKNNNTVSLVCRYDPEVGWYEFNVANNGLYSILFMEVAPGGKIRENRIANGGSNNIKAGLETNEYLAKCKGNELSLTINGQDVITIQDKKYGLSKGQVGISVSSFNVLPILIEMDWIKISEP